MSERHTWVVGAGGMLGRAVSEAILSSPTNRLFGANVISLHDADGSIEILRRELDRFLTESSPQEKWTIYWVAGAGVIGSSPEAFAVEQRVFSAFVEALAAQIDEEPAHSARGAFFLASSASVYAGNEGAPYTESSEPKATSEYSRAKLSNELAVSRFLEGRIPHVIGRITTLYGTGQNLHKGQGLVSKLCMQAVTQQPIQVYVPLDTLRDYLFAPDAAQLAIAFTDVAAASGSTSTRVRNLSCGMALTIGALTALVRHVSHRRAGELHIVPNTAGAHVRVLRVLTNFQHEVPGISRESVPAAIRTVFEDVFTRYVQGDLSRLARVLD